MLKPVTINGISHDFSTPKGNLTVWKKEKDPMWTPPDWYYTKDAPPVEQREKQKILGKYALYLSCSGIMIHGTTDTMNIGKNVSHGCIRMNDKDLETTYRLLSVKSRVYIY